MSFENFIREGKILRIQGVLGREINIQGVEDRRHRLPLVKLLVTITVVFCSFPASHPLCPPPGAGFLCLFSHTKEARRLTSEARKWLLELLKVTALKDLIILREDGTSVSSYTWILTLFSVKHQKLFKSQFQKGVCLFRFVIWYIYK